MQDIPSPNSAFPNSRGNVNETESKMPRSFTLRRTGRWCHSLSFNKKLNQHHLHPKGSGTLGLSRKADFGHLLCYPRPYFSVHGTVAKYQLLRFILEKMSSFTLSKLQAFFSEGLEFGILRQPLHITPFLQTSSKIVT